MFEGQASRTAERVAVERAAHQIIDAPPRVLTDPFAVRVLSADQAAQLRAHPREHDAKPITKPMRALVVVRSRIAEDEMARAAQEGVRQYVLLGAGLDTFAYRNPLPAVRVFEVDDAATQRLKRDRLRAAGIEVPQTAALVPCNFAREPFLTALQNAGFDPSQPAVFAWLGVAMYLDRSDAFRTLDAIAGLPPRTAVVFDYALPPDAVPWLARMFYRRVLRRLDAQGEPWQTFFEPAPLRDALVGLGFTEIEDLGPADIDARYLAGRTDGLESGSIGRIATARRRP
jgi:methyltransferase (TIGR00027 family)